MNFSSYHSPIGELLLVGDPDGLTAIHFPNGKKQPSPQNTWVSDSDVFSDVIRQLDGYFDGTLKQFDVRLKPTGTPFQQDVWTALLTIEYGDTQSYGDIAKLIDKPTASRAVGAANGANPIPIIIPCHRVIGTSGALTGFGGGLPTKHWLLGHESGALSLLPFAEWTVQTQQEA